MVDHYVAISSLAELIREHYLFADKAEELAHRVQGWAAEIDGDQPEAEFSTTLTELLHDTTDDRHFRIMPRVFTAEERAAAPEDRWKYMMPGVASNYGFRSVEVTDGTALITLDSLDYIKWSRPTAIAAMDFARHASQVLIDVRGCRGGDPELIGLIAGYFLGPSPVELSTVHWRDGTTETLSSDPDGASFQFAPTVGLVVVVGPNTASGGEALADHMRGPGRAVVVGQPTAGGAHRIKEFQLTDQLVARIPSGYVANAFTGANWQGHGVSPDLEVEPADDVIAIATQTAIQGSAAR